MYPGVVQNTLLHGPLSYRQRPEGVKQKRRQWKRGGSVPATGAAAWQAPGRRLSRPAKRLAGPAGIGYRSPTMAAGDAVPVTPDTRAFELSGIRFREILDIEHLELDSCRISAIVGPSGGGKTTLLRCLNRMTTPDAGRILFEGQPLEAIDPVQLRRRVVMLAQMPVIFPSSVEENLLIGCRLAEKPLPDREAMRAMLLRVGLGKPFDEDAARLSGGEKQRLSLARVMLMDPEVLLLDEPSASLDGETEEQIFTLITEFCRERCKTLVMVTHSEAEFSGYYDALVRIRAGRVESVRQREGG
jgi:putative ABC transport system ATP-binding protein